MFKEACSAENWPLPYWESSQGKITLMKFLITCENRSILEDHNVPFYAKTFALQFPHSKNYFLTDLL